MRPTIAALAWIALSACTIAQDYDALGPGIGDASPACGSATLAPCAVIPRFSGEQTIDGVDDEFGCVPALTFTLADAVATAPSPPPPLPLSVRLRVGWSPYGLHVHVRVEDAKIAVASTLDNLHNGDAIELYLAGHQDLTGSFDGVTKDPGAMQIVAAPPSGTLPARAVIVYPTSSARVPLERELFAARTDATGWSIELKMPWSRLRPSKYPPATSGTGVAFDFAIDAKDDPSLATREVTAIYARLAVTGGCGVPPCDDRTWCRPTLE